MKIENLSHIESKSLLNLIEKESIRFNTIFAEENISSDIIRDIVFDCVMYRVKNFIEGKKSLISYIKEFLNLDVFQMVYRELIKRRKQIDIEDVENCLSDKKSLEKEILFNDYYRYIYEKCSKLQQKILDLLYIGYKQKEISKILKVSESQISKEIKKMQKICK